MNGVLVELLILAGFRQVLVLSWHVGILQSFSSLSAQHFVWSFICCNSVSPPDVYSFGIATVEKPHYCCNSTLINKGIITTLGVSQVTSTTKKHTQTHSTSVNTTLVTILFCVLSTFHSLAWMPPFPHLLFPQKHLEGQTLYSTQELRPQLNFSWK